MIYSYLAWITAAVFVFFQLFLQSASTIMNEAWAQDFELNNIELSYLSSSFFYSYMLMQVPIGIIYDRFSSKKVLFSAALTLSFGCILMSFAQTFSLALFSRLFMGVGSAFGFVGLLKIISQYFPSNRFALMFGIAEALGMITVALGIVALPAFLLQYSWREAMLLSGVFAGILSLTILLLVRNKKIENPLPLSLPCLITQFKTSLMNRQLFLCSLYGFFIVAIMNCFTSLWGEPFLVHTYNFEPQIASILISAVFIGLAFGSPINGWFSKRFGNNLQLMFWEALLSFLTTSLLIFVPNLSFPTLFGLLFLTGFFSSSYVPCFAQIKESVNSEIEATAIATANMIVVASAPVLQIVIGSLLHSYCFGCASDIITNYQYALAVLPLSYFLALGISVFIKKEPNRNNC